MSKCFLQIKNEWKIKQCNSPSGITWPPFFHRHDESIPCSLERIQLGMLDAAAQGRRGGTGCRGSDRRTRTLGRSLSHGLMTVPGRGRAARPGVGSSGPHWLTSGASWIWKSLWNQSSHHPAARIPLPCGAPAARPADRVLRRWERKPPDLN